MAKLSKLELPDVKEQYMRYREQLLEVVGNPSDSEYDAIYYFIGQYDYDPSNKKAVELVADLALTIATESKNVKYEVDLPKNYNGLLFNHLNYQGVVPPNIAERIAKRSAAIVSARHLGVGYVPDPERFKSLIESAFLANTSDELNRELERQYGHNVFRPSKNVVGYRPSSGWNIGWVIAVVVFCVFIIATILSRL